MVQNMMAWFFDYAAMLNDSSSICELFQLTELSKLNTFTTSIGKIISPIILSHLIRKTIGQLDKKKVPAWRACSAALLLTSLARPFMLPCSLLDTTSGKFMKMMKGSLKCLSTALFDLLYKIYFRF